MAFSYKAKTWHTSARFPISNTEKSTIPRRSLDSRQRIVSNACQSLMSYIWQSGVATNLLTKIKCFLLTGEVVLHPILGALNKPSLRIVKKKYSSLPFAFTGILPLPGHSRFVKIYLIRQSLTAFCFSLRPPSSGYSCIRHYLLVPYGF